MIFTKKTILLLLSIFILYGCYSAIFTKNSNTRRSNIDYIYIGIKSSLTNNYNNYIGIWIEKQTNNEQLNIEASLNKSNISFRKEEYAYFIDEMPTGFFIRHIPVVKRNERVFVNENDITNIGNVAISKGSKITLGGFYGL